MSVRPLQLPVLLVLLVGLPAVAQEKAGASSPAPAATPAPPAEVHASHRVEVIAPGERVDTVIDRMRGDRSTAPAPREVRDSTTPPVRGPDHRPGDAPSADGQGRPGMGPPGGSGTPPSGGGGLPQPGRGGDSAPPDRPRR